MAIFFIFPKNISRLWIFGLILLADVYLWNSFKKVFRRNSGSPFYFFRVFYWFPEIMMVALLAIALFFRNVDAQNTLSSFVIGIAMMVFGAKIMAFFIISFEFLTRIFSWISMSFVDGKILWKFPVPRKKRIIKASLYLFYFLFFLFICGIFNTHRFEVKKEIVQTENLPQAFDGLKVVQISDIHLVSWILPRKMEKVVEKINELNPDIVAFTGDMVSFKSVEMLPYIDILSKVKAKYGVFTILGNHDYGDYVNWKNDEEKVQNFEDIITYYKQTSWVLLRNENRRIYSSDSSSSIVVAGVENWSASKRFHGIGNADLALKNVSDDDFVIFLSHDPSHWEYLMKKNTPIDLTLSGHTHAMQFGIDCCGIKWSPVSWVYKYWAGLYVNESSARKQKLYVNVGLGTVGFVSRVGFLPEITLLELQRSTDN
ncbi:MAG: metallophosphoesterase [Bacteroidales bacterium]|nr:metallophosphoesterase [Bacteroidales bacterium]